MWNEVLNQMDKTQVGKLGVFLWGGDMNRVTSLE
jgi:hypothetical protein